MILAMLPFLAMGFLNSLHCLGMCGPVALSFSAQASSPGMRGSQSSLLRLQLSYNLGRVLTYTLVGGLLGLAGSLADSALVLAGMQNGMALLAAAVLVLLALSQFGLLPQWISRAPARWRLPGLPALGRLKKSSSGRGRFALGMVLGFMPCMLTTSMFIHALGSGSAVQGSLKLLAFGLGTIPILFALGFFSCQVLHRLKKWSPLLMGMGMLFIAYELLHRALFLDGPAPGSTQLFCN